MLDIILEWLPAIVPAVLALISLFLSEGAKKKLKGVLEEMPKLRNSLYREKGIQENEKQSFSEVVKDTAVDKHTDKVVETGILTNIQEIIQSCAETALQKILAKYLPDVDGEVVKDDYFTAASDLDAITETLTELDSLKANYGLPETATVYDLQSYLNNKIAKSKKEVKPNETEKVEKENEQA